MNRWIKTATVFVSLLLVPGAMAGDGAIEIWQPTTITEPGKYILTRDISSTSDVITIDADDVHLDLNGHTVYLAQTIHYGIWIRANRTGVTVENGTIKSNGAWPVFVDSNVRGFTLRRTTVKGGRIQLDGSSSNLVIEDNVFLIDTINPMFLGCSNSRLTGNEVHNVSAGGVNLGGNANYFANNTIAGCSGIGLLITGHRNHVVGNQLSDNTSYGLQTNGHNNVYQGNIARGNAGTGCTGPSTTDMCDRGIGNTSSGDNFIPHQM